MSVEESLFEAEDKMEKAVEVAKEDFSAIRTGRANPSMFNRIVIEYYGTMTPITQVSSINVPEARLVVIKPYEANQLGNIETAIRTQAPVSYGWHLAIGLLVTLVWLYLELLRLLARLRSD